MSAQDTQTFWEVDPSFEQKKVNLSLEQSHESIKKQIADLKDQYFLEVKRAEENWKFPMGPGDYISDIATVIGDQIVELQFIDNFLTKELPTEAADIRSKVRENLKSFNDINPIVGLNRDSMLEQHYNNLKDIRSMTSYMREITQIKLTLLEKTIFKTNVDDLMAQSFRHGSYEFYPRANNADINDIFAEAFLETKNLDWRNNFKLSDYKKDWVYSLDSTKEEFYTILAKASKEMDDETLFYFRNGSITINLQGEKVTMASDMWSRGMNIDRKYEHIIQMEINKRKENTPSSTGAPTKAIPIKYTPEATTIISDTIISESTSTDSIPSPRPKPENENPVSETNENNEIIEKGFQEAFSSNSPERFFKFERYSQFSDRSKEVASIICDTYNQIGNVDTDFFAEYQWLYTKDVLMWIQLTESGYKQDAQSHANAVGVMQNMNISIRDNYLSILLLNKNGLNIKNPGKISEQTAAEVQNIMKIDSNLWRSAWKIHFRMLVSPRYKISDMRVALAAYNAGHWVKWKPETKWPEEAQDYVKKNLQYQKNLALVSAFDPELSDNIRMRIVRDYGHSNGDITNDYIIRKLEKLS